MFNELNDEYVFIYKKIDQCNVLLIILFLHVTFHTFKATDTFGVNLHFLISNNNN